MAPSRRIRKAFGVVKDQTRISIAKVASNLDPELEILIVKATSHDNDVSNDRVFDEILRRGSISKEVVVECVGLICRRIERTRDWIVALKCLILVHRILIKGGEVFMEEIACANVSHLKGGGMLSNMCVFKDEAHPNSWDYTEFVRRYGMYLDEKVELMVFDNMWLRRRLRVSVGLDESESKDENSARMTQLSDEMGTKRVLGRMEQSQRLLERVLAMRPRTVSQHQKLVILALCPVVEESFKLYEEICEGLSYLLDKFWGMEYWNMVKSLGTYVTVAKQIDELVEFYAWCKDFGVVTSSEYLVVERISDDLLRTMGLFMKNKEVKAKGSTSTDQKNTKKDEPDSAVVSMKQNEDESNKSVMVEEEPISNNFVGEFQELINLKDDEAPNEDHSKKLALGLFSDNQGNPWENASNCSETATGTHENEPSDWELALVDSVSKFNPKTELGGGFDNLLLDSLYSQNTVSNNANFSQTSVGGNTILALPSTNAPPKTPQAVDQDPFAASVAVPPPAYVQMAEMETQQRLMMMQQQQVWQQHVANGMQGQSSFVQLNNGVSSYNAFGPQTMTPYEMTGNSVHSTGHHYNPWTN